VDPETGATEASNYRQATKKLQRAVNKLYLEGDTAGLMALAAEATTLAERSSGAARRRALSVAEEARLYAMLGSSGPAPHRSGSNGPVLGPGVGALFGGVIGFVVGVALGVAAYGNATDIPEANDLAALFVGLFGLVVGSGVGLAVGAVLKKQRRQ
jgi:hypothetical protein